MSAITRRTTAQGAVTAAVLAAGITMCATSGGAAAATSSAVHAPTRVSHAASSPSYMHPKGHPANPKPDGTIPEQQRSLRHLQKRLSHPKHEAWPRLLVNVPHGWSTTLAHKSLSRHELSKEFNKPSAVSRILKFNGYRRGVVRGMISGHRGVAEELWQFGKPTGAGAWYIAYTRSNRPGPSSLYSHSFPIGTHGARGYMTSHLDSAGYHSGVGTAIEGDIIVHVRVFSTSKVTRGEIAHQLRLAERPVARGISMAGPFGQAVGTVSSTTPPVTT